MERNHLQGCGLQFRVGAANEIFQHRHAIAEVARIEGTVEHAAVRHAAREDDPLSAEIPQQEIKIGRVESRKPLFSVDHQIALVYGRHKLRPAAPCDRMFTRVGSLPDMQWTGHPPCWVEPLHIVIAARPQYGPHMNYRDTMRARNLV